MAVTAYVYGKLFANAFGGETAGESVAIDILSDTLKVMLTTSSYSPNQDTHEFKSSVTNEVSGTGYTAAGQALTSVTWAYASRVTTLDADDPTWATATITARKAVYYDSTPGSDATRPLLVQVDFGGDVTSTSGNYSIIHDSSGIMTITVAA